MNVNYPYSCLSEEAAYLLMKSKDKSLPAKLSP